ncbi:MAG: helix-turn-helix domain-containing protein [Sphingomonas sp.]
MAVLDESKVGDGARFKGLEIELHRYSGARVLRVVHPGEQDIGEHRHDWAYIGLHTAGRYLEQYDGGEAAMDGPSAVLHPAGRPHADRVPGTGLETLTIEFDPAWLRVHGFAVRLDRSRVWSGGAVGLQARRLAAAIAQAACDERQVARATAQFLAVALAKRAIDPPPWLASARQWALKDEEVSTAEIARRLDLNPAYLAHAYLHATGEGLGETLRRRRVEAASSMLRHTRLPPAEIAVAAGFCDQSHMNRCFAAVLGRTPLRVRQERQLFEERGGPFATGDHFARRPSSRAAIDPI